MTSLAPDQVFAALVEDGTFEWTDGELGMVAGTNLMNTFRCSLFLPAATSLVSRSVEAVRDLMKAEGVQADNSWSVSTFFLLGLVGVYYRTRLKHFFSKYLGPTGTACILILCPERIPKHFDFHL